MGSLLIGRKPPVDLGHTYVDTPPYEAVVIGSLELGELLYFQNPQVLQADMAVVTASNQPRPVSFIAPEVTSVRMI